MQTTSFFLTVPVAAPVKAASASVITLTVAALGRWLTPHVTVRLGVGLMGPQ